MAKAKKQADLVADPKKEGIPVELQVQNRDKWQKPSPELQTQLEKAKEASNRIVPFDKPKGMSVEEYEAKKSRDRQAREAKDPKVKKSVKKAKKEPLPADTFRLIDMAREEGIEPRDARGVARSVKEKLKTLEVHGKYVYALKSRADVLKIIKDGLAKETTTKAEKKKVKAKIPSGAVWSSKAKKAKVKVEPPTSKKAVARAEAKEAMKGRKKIKTGEDEAIYVKKRVK